MDCRTCQPSLVDLLYGELAPDVADAARDHIGGCTSCRTAFERLQSGQMLAEQLPVEEPPQKVSAHLLQLAEAHAAERARQHAAAAQPRSPWVTLIELLRRLAMGPQLGMATIMLLIVAVGLWSVPQLSRAPEAAGDTVVNPDPEGQARATPGVQPAEPLDLEMDMRRRRIRTGEELAQQAAEPAAAPPPPPRTEAAAAEEEPQLSLREDEVLAELQADAPADLDSLSEGKRREAKPAAKGALGRGAVGSGASPEPFADSSAARQAFPGSGNRTARAPARAPKAARPAKARAMKKKKSSGRMDDLMAMPYGEAAPSAPAPTAAPAKQAEEAASAPTLADKAERAQTARERQVELLQLARATRASSGCAAALPHYQRAASSGGRSATRGEALIELAQCQQKLGRQAEAQRSLQRALKNPAVAARARRLLGQQAPASDEAAAETQGE